MSERLISPDIRRPDRLPPGQRWIEAPVVYDIVPERPKADLKNYRFRIWGLVEAPQELTLDELKALGSVQVLADFHCVTRWSVKEILWEGVQARRLLELARPMHNAHFVLAHSLDFYTTNVPLEYLTREDVLFAWGMNGAEIPTEHGHPLRLVIPALYAWKSAKYVLGLEFRETDMPGFWEDRGYHMRGDPWKEEMYSSK
jgi:DMSO/TMAO reductase YedYZ molybdopterin-dependent catalytic subunit